MDGISLAILILGIVTLAGGLIAGFILYIKSIKDTAIKDAKIDLLQREIDNIANIRSYFIQTITTLKNYGYILPAADPLNITPDDIVIEPRTEPEKPTANIDPNQLPIIQDLNPQTVLDALVHAANRTGSRADRPFSRRYMTRPQGPLKHSEYNTILNYLIQNGYLDDDVSNSPMLTDKGHNLLKLVR